MGGIPAAAHLLHSCCCFFTAGKVNLSHSRVVYLVPAGSGKTTTLEGARGKDMRGSAEGDGLVHAALDTLYELIHAKAVSVGRWH
jgi:hypothetical protein